MCEITESLFDLTSSENLCDSETWSSSMTKEISRLFSESYHSFVKKYMQPNKPCIFSSEVTVDWKSLREWVTSNGQPNFNYLSNEFGSSIVPVVVCDDKDFSCCDRKNMSFKNYIEQHMQTNSSKSDNETLFYLKDWHFNRAYPKYKAYSTPKYFCEDWLNEYCMNENDDFQFVYMGPKGTWTPLHMDVYGSYSWSANICGRKRWLLFAPGQEKLLQKNSKHLPHMLKENEVSNLDVLYLDVIQEPGEIIFVPSGWYHQVWNLEDTISINHNWFNQYNILYIWNCLNIAATDVERELSDLKEFDDWQIEHQALLKAHHGMNFYDFFKILNFIFESREHLIIESKDVSKQAVSELESIKNVCKKMVSNSLPEDLLENVTNLSAQIINILSECSKMLH